ncbi:hypothetical protein [Maricaulis sp.]|uniref:hypothetical protein n=1 Tax=Maricaulis sp. TaxID=1486257 RepID=UPI002620B849|nr:hypothetical protein [Maricaulis sp.]
MVSRVWFISIPTLAWAAGAAAAEFVFLSAAGFGAAFFATGFFGADFFGAGLATGFFADAVFAADFFTGAFFTAALATGAAGAVSDAATGLAMSRGLEGAAGLAALGSVFGVSVMAHTVLMLDYIFAVAAFIRTCSTPVKRILCTAQNPDFARGLGLTGWKQPAL